MPTVCHAVSHWNLFCRHRAKHTLQTIYMRKYIRWNDVTESMVTIRPPFCGYNTIYCVEVNGEDLSWYSNKTESVSLRKCTYYDWLTNNNKPCLSAITVANIYKSFTYKMVAKINWHRYGTKLRHCRPMYSGFTTKRTLYFVEFKFFQ